MLGKLLKYDLKSNAVIMCIVFAAVAVATVGEKVALYFAHEYDDNPYIGISSMSMTMIYAMILIAAVFIAVFLVFRRFYNNCFGKEGYLTFTLPAKATHIYWSKYISALIILTAVAAIVIASLFVVAGNDARDILGFFKDIKTVMFDGIDVNPVLLTVLYILSVVVSFLFFISTVYCAICIGQNFKVHTLIASIVAYLIISWTVSILLSMISAVILVVSDRFGDTAFGKYIIISEIVQITVHIIGMIAEHFYCIHKMKKGLNLK